MINEHLHPVTFIAICAEPNPYVLIREFGLANETSLAQPYDCASSPTGEHLCVTITIYTENPSLSIRK